LLKSRKRSGCRTARRLEQVLSSAFVGITLQDAIGKTELHPTLAFEDETIQLLNARGVRNDQPLSAFFTYKDGAPQITLHVYLLLVEP
jgi:hypothetical protein